MLDGERLEKIAEIPVGQEPWSLAIAPDGATVYVITRGDGELVAVDAATQTVRRRLAVGAEPAAVTLTPDGRKAYVTLMAENAVAVVDLACFALMGKLSVAPVPYALAVVNHGGKEHVYVTHLLSQPIDGGSEASDDGRQGIVSVIDATTDQVVETVELGPNAQGFPSRNTGIAIANGYAWLPHVRAAPDLPNGLTTMVFAAVSVIDVESQREAAFLPLNDDIIFGSPINNPEVAIPSPAGDRLYVAAAGSDLVEVIDVTNVEQPRLIGFIGVGHNPLGMAVDAEGRRGYVMNYLSRSVSVLDLSALEAIDEIRVSDETLDPALVRGKQLFANASHPHLSRGSWISCASCHFDGWPDGVTWRFPDGPRQTPMLWNAGETLPWHWSAALDEAQDVEETIEQIQHGIGLAPGDELSNLGPPLAGHSADLDALARFLTEGFRTPNLPAPDLLANRGRTVFMEQGCADCHGGSAWTSSRLPQPAGETDPDGNGMVDNALRAVGTLNPLDVRGDTGFDPPSLLGVGLTAPYLHDGSMTSLEMLFQRGHPAPGQGATLPDDTMASLAAFLRSINKETPPVESPTPTFHRRNR